MSSIGLGLLLLGAWVALVFFGAWIEDRDDRKFYNVE
jgi:hypothetical protein